MKSLLDLGRGSILSCVVKFETLEFYDGPRIEAKSSRIGGLMC